MCRWLLDEGLELEVPIAAGERDRVKGALTFRVPEPLAESAEDGTCGLERRSGINFFRLSFGPLRKLCWENALPRKPPGRSSSVSSSSELLLDAELQHR